MESNPDDLLILTIVIQMHGKIINFDLDQRQLNIFENVRLLCKAGDFVDYHTTPISELTLVSGLKKDFTRDLDSSTYDIIKKTIPGVFVDHITYDKSLSITIGEPTILDSFNPLTYIQGIYLLSIHKGGTLVYPSKNKIAIDLLQLSDLDILARIFGTRVPNIEDLSTKIPSQKIYIEEENIVKNDNSLSEEDKNKIITQIRWQFYKNLSNWQLTLHRNTIISIKLSTLVELVKTIVGKPCIINLLDYSCNSPTIYIPKEQETLKQYALKESDIEMGINKMELEGGKKNRVKRIKRIKRNNYKSRRNKYKSKRNCLNIYFQTYY